MRSEGHLGRENQPYEQKHGDKKQYRVQEGNKAQYVLR